MKPSAFPSPILRPLVDADCTLISQDFARQGWRKPVEQNQAYLREAAQGRREILVAEVDGAFAGYLTIVWESDYLPFQQAGIPEIVDLNVLQKFQRRGIATTLLDAAEGRIAERAQIAGIGVGLTADYGPAQALYVKRGYVPDGRGAVSHGAFIRYGESISVDDDLVLYLTRVLETVQR
jgi:ribosomal protein S18 acetylase RimI-like enzyme